MGAEGGSAASQAGWEDPFTRREGEFGALEEARFQHSMYLTALADWEEFQRDYGEKIQLWTTIQQLVTRSRHTDDSSTEELYDALGVSEYFEDELETNWSGDASVDTALHISNAKDSALKQGKQVTWEDAEKTGNEFIDFGREIVSRRVLVEIRAHKLILRMKYGLPSLEDDKRIAWWNAGMDQFQPPDLSEANAFYVEFLKRPLDQQIAIVERLTARLAHCHRGRVFLAHLFEYREMAIFNPNRLARPGPAWKREDESDPKEYVWGDEAIEMAMKRKVSILPKQPSELTRFYTADGRVTVDADPDIRTDSIEEHLTQALLQLLPGLNHFYAHRSTDEQYLADPEMPDPDLIVSNFVGIVTATYFTDTEIQAAVDATDWSETRYDEPTIVSPTLLEETWTPQDTENMAKVLLVSTDSLVEARSRPAGRWTAPLVVLSKSLGAIGGVSTLSNPSKTDTVEQIKAIKDIADAIASLEIVDRYLPERLPDTIPDEPLRRRLTRNAKLMSRALSHVASLLDVVGMILSTIDFVEEIRSGDFDSAAGYAIMGLGSVATMAAPFVIGMPLLVVGIALGLIGALVVGIFDDSAVADWIKTTRFGTLWRTLDTEDFLDPRESTYGYRRIVPDPNDPVGDVDCGRQLSALYSLIRPIGVETIELDRDERLPGDEERYVGKIEISPSDAYPDEADIGILKRGYLFLRPLPVYRDLEVLYTPLGSNVLSEKLGVSENTSGEYLHRFSLADAQKTTPILSRTNGGTVDDRWRSMLGAYEPSPALKLLGRWLDVDFKSNDLALDIHEARTVRPDEEDVVTEWSARVWDMSSGSSHNRIFGWPVGAMGWGPEPIPDIWIGGVIDLRFRYVEMIYVPPHVAHSIMRQGTVSVRPEELPIVSRERRPVMLSWEVVHGN
ncbi:hypothetical protein [Natrinema gelatinilyticum]|uniref:hypothetical protein n=1 Tax=Natrinema gelatinilyticum TaxID=2961571 RepID=UPI0020C26276|nr:hypothetical protein [Natrinema gelatinilyticum]